MLDEELFHNASDEEEREKENLERILFPEVKLPAVRQYIPKSALQQQKEEKARIKKGMAAARSVKGRTKRAGNEDDVGVKSRREMKTAGKSLMKVDDINDALSGIGDANASVRQSSARALLKTCLAENGLLLRAHGLLPRLFETIHKGREKHRDDAELTLCLAGVAYAISKDARNAEHVTREAIGELVEMVKEGYEPPKSDNSSMK